MRNISVHIIFALLCTLLFASVAQAEVRVLIKFDDDTHSLHRIVDVDSINPVLLQEQVATSMLELVPGKASVRWLDASGAILFTENINDPRLTHAPLSKTDATPTMVGLVSGAYMVTGPTGSRTLEVRLPANNALALTEQTWEFQLKQ